MFVLDDQSREAIDRFGTVRLARLTVLRRASSMGGKRRWLCQCDCGVVKIFYDTNLIRGFSRSCGCLSKERTSVAARIHGGSGSVLYGIWANMKQRCSDPTRRSFPRYGGRGISVCPMWQADFEPFRDWALDAGYTKGLLLDRRDNDKGYSPDNCRWVTPKQSARNTSQNVLITAYGETKGTADWASDRRCAVSSKRLAERIRQGWSPERAITQRARS